MESNATLSPTEELALLAALAPNGKHGHAHVLAYRNTLIALLMLDAGCRAYELTHLLHRDAYWQDQPRPSLEIRTTHAKYNVGGNIPLSPRLRSALIAYADHFHTDGPVLHEHWLLYNRTPDRPLSRRQVHRIISEAAAQVLPRAIHPHMLRHTFADRLSQVCDVPTLQSLLRHKHLSSTQKYVHVTPSRMATAVAAASALLPPTSESL